jgi:hypothetical protein
MAKKATNAQIRSLFIWNLKITGANIMQISDPAKEGNIIMKSIEKYSIFVGISTFFERKGA